MEHKRLAKLLKRGAILALLLLSPVFLKAQTADSQQINDLLKEIKTHAVLAENDAATLRSFLFSRITAQSHAVRLNQIKTHANDLIVDYNQLISLRSSGSPWQQEAVDRIGPLLKEMATHMSATIAHFNDNRSQTSMPPYQNYVKANQQLISKTARLISDFVDYGESKAEADALEKTLLLPETARENP